MKLEIGQQISFSYKGTRVTGTVLQREGGVLLKLKSGYNMTVPLDELRDVEEVKVTPKRRAPQSRPAPKQGLPKVHLLHTGGTIASRVDYETGAVIAQYTAEEVLQLYPELLSIADVTSTLVSNIQSEMARFAHWNLLIEAVQNAVAAGAEGVIVTHGTDTLHYAAAALAFALKNIPIPVILVGSQRSSDRPSSDAKSNLLCAATFIAQSGFRGVGICMHESMSDDACVILPACRSRKMHTSRRDAFRPINDAPYARITYPDLVVEQVRPYPEPAGPFEVKPFKKVKVGLFQLHPNLYAEELLVFEKFDGLVLGLFGIGHAPTMVTDEQNKEHAKILDVITKLAKKLVVVGAPQTIYGRVNMQVYSPGRQLLEAGVLGQGCDVTPETAFVKLAWLLSNYDKREVRRLYGQNLRGECSPRSRIVK